MNAIHRDIKIEVEKCYKNIKENEEQLSILRKKCSHPDTESVNYEFRPGRIVPQTRICKICGETIRKLK